VEVYGETPALKDSLIAISLRHNIRCRYTAYIADYREVYDNTAMEKGLSAQDDKVPCSYLVNNYPNPFNASTIICFYISANDLHSGEKFIKIYNSLGQLVAVIDISHLGEGFHSIRFDGNNFNGVPLPSGLYFVRLQTGQALSTIRVTLVK
jgi:flagellar hook assembly protein FlgD